MRTKKDTKEWLTMPKALVEFMKVEEVDGKPIGLNPKFIEFIRPASAGGCTEITFSSGEKVVIRAKFDDALVDLMGVDAE